MEPTSNDQLVRVADYVRQRLDQIGEAIPQSSADEIRNLLDHDEHEMAFELYVLAIMKHSQFLRSDYDDVLTYAKLLGLDKESVFDADFWEKLRRYDYR